MQILQLQKDAQAAKSTVTKTSQAAKSAPPAKPVAQPQQQRVAGAAATAVAGGGAGQQPVAQPQQQQVYYSPVVSMRKEEAVRYVQPVHQEMRLVGYEPKYEVVNVPAYQQQQMPSYQQQLQPYQQQPQLLTRSGAYATGQQFSGQRPPAYCIFTQF
jgi:hypothetical protein